MLHLSILINNNHSPRIRIVQQYGFHTGFQIPATRLFCRLIMSLTPQCVDMNNYPEKLIDKY